MKVGKSSHDDAGASDARKNKTLNNEEAIAGQDESVPGADYDQSRRAACYSVSTQYDLRQHAPAFENSTVESGT